LSAAFTLPRPCDERADTQSVLRKRSVVIKQARGEFQRLSCRRLMATTVVALVKVMLHSNLERIDGTVLVYRPLHFHSVVLDRRGFSKHLRSNSPRNQIQSYQRQARYADGGVRPLGLLRKMVPNPTRQVRKAFDLKASPRRQGSARNCLEYVCPLWVAAAVAHMYCEASPSAKTHDVEFLCKYNC
jgi:hypothetical protein